MAISRAEAINARSIYKYNLKKMWGIIETVINYNVQYTNKSQISLYGNTD